MAVEHEKSEETTVSHVGPVAPDDVATQLVEISSLELGGSPRLGGENVDHVHLLAQSSSDLPPILVHRGSMRVIDGMHRLRAAALTGQDRIRAIFFEGSERDAFVLAVQANIAHGLPLSLQDRRAAAKRIIASHLEWSDRAISLIVGLAARTVAEIRAATAEPLQTDTRIGLDGRSRPVNSAERRRLAGELMLKNPDAPLREIAREAEISPATVSDVRDRIRRGEDPVPARLLGPAKERIRHRDEPTLPAARVVDDALFEKLTKAIESLRSDPMLRFNESGRQLLRTLGSCIAIGQSRYRIVANTPPLRASCIAELAFGCALVLHDFAEGLQRTYPIPSQRQGGPQSGMGSR